MTSRAITAWTIYLLLTAIIMFDTVMIVNKTSGDTISEITLAAARKWPIIAFAIGVVVGHLFWPQR